MTSRTASNLLALHAGLALGAWIEGGPTMLLVTGIVIGLLNLAMFHCTPMNEGE